jgi:hypothetical protein
LDNLRDRSFQIGPFKGFAVNEEHEDVEDEYIDDNYSEATPKASAKDKRAKGGKRTAPSSKKKKNKKAKAPTAAGARKPQLWELWPKDGGCCQKQLQRKFGRKQRTIDTRVSSIINTGKILVRYTKDMFIFVWMDRKPVRILSTFSSPEIETFPHISVPNLMMKKPKAIREYNHVMPGVDGADQMRHIKTITRQQQKNPYKKV